MTPEDVSTAQEGRAWREARELGFDMSLIEANLYRSPAERIRQHARALETALLLRAAMERKRAESRNPS